MQRYPLVRSSTRTQRTVCREDTDRLDMAVRVRDMTTAQTVRIEPRFCGPARSGHGGYVAGLVAAGFDGTDPVRVRLRKPPPLATELELSIDGTAGTLSGAGGLIADAATVDAAVLDDAWVEPVGPDEARAAEASFGGLVSHPFPTCFGCGPDNALGLRLRPGHLGDRRTACTWRPAADLAGADGRVGTPFLWAALDCPGGWTMDLEGRPSVLGQLTVCVDAYPEAGEPCVVMGRRLGEDGRKTLTAATLYDSDGRILARAGHIWIAIDPVDFN